MGAACDDILLVEWPAEAGGGFNRAALWARHVTAQVTYEEWFLGAEFQ